MYLLGAICGSAQSVDPYIAQESMDCAGICGSRLLARSSIPAPRSIPPTILSHMFVVPVQL